MEQRTWPWVVGGIFLFSTGLFGLSLVVSGRPRAPCRIAVPLIPHPKVPTEVLYSSPTTTEATPIETVSLLVVGDIMLDRNVETRTMQSNDPAYPFRRLPDGWLNSADYTIANLEGPLTDARRPPEKTIDFRFLPKWLPVLKETGIDAVSQANNHALDQGKAGYEDSVKRLREGGLLVFGHQGEDGDISLATTTVKGVSFAFVGFNTTDNPLDREAAAEVLRRARGLAQFVLVFMHWGEEYQHTPTASVQELGKWLVDHGADAGIGGHPHWEQGISLYKGVPIVWSLGNFIFDQDFSLETRQGLAVKLVFSKHPLSSAAFMTSLEPIPLQIDASQPRVVEGEERVSRLKELATYSDPGILSSIIAGTNPSIAGIGPQPID